MRFAPRGCRLAGATGDGTTGAITAAGGGAGGLAGGLDIIAPIIENTTPPVMNAMNSLKAASRRWVWSYARKRNRVLCNRLVRTVICAIVETSTGNG